jgi:outer membrane immunogenic protein
MEHAMSRTIVSPALAAALSLAAAPALAADIMRAPAPVPYAAPVAVAGYNWTGFYAGANAGYGWGAMTNFPLNPKGFLGGVQAGYNWQTGQFVFGAETDVQISSADDTFAAYKFSNPWFGTVRGRAGYAMNNVLLYATAGLAYGSGKLQIAGLSEDHTHTGWTAGGGIEVGFTPNWSAKAEYLYIDLNDKGYVLSGTTSGLTANLVRFGVNYRF